MNGLNIGRGRGGGHLVKIFEKPKPQRPASSFNRCVAGCMKCICLISNRSTCHSFVLRTQRDDLDQNQLYYRLLIWTEKWVIGAVLLDLAPFLISRRFSLFNSRTSVSHLSASSASQCIAYIETKPPYLFC